MKEWGIREALQRIRFGHLSKGSGSGREGWSGKRVAWRTRI